MPPFAGSDEFDHAYRAAAAARGQWAIDPVDATRGTGAFVTVPADIVEAARSECQHLRYTKDHDCIGKPASDGNVVVASGAGRYHPLFYAVIGTAAKPFDGAAALYAMRIATALLAAAFVWIAVRAAATWARSPMALPGHRRGLYAGGDLQLLHRRTQRCRDDGRARPLDGAPRAPAGALASTSGPWRRTPGSPAPCSPPSARWARSGACVALARRPVGRADRAGSDRRAPAAPRGARLGRWWWR